MSKDMTDEFKWGALHGVSHQCRLKYFTSIFPCSCEPWWRGAPADCSKCRVAIEYRGVPEEEKKE